MLPDLRAKQQTNVPSNQLKMPNLSLNGQLEHSLVLTAVGTYLPSLTKWVIPCHLV